MEGLAGALAQGREHETIKVSDNPGECGWGRQLASPWQVIVTVRPQRALVLVHTESNTEIRVSEA